MSQYHLAHVNIARMRYEYDSPEFRDFVQALEPVNADADQSPGFVWRFEPEAGLNSEVESFEANGWLFNMSVWTSLDSLVSFVRSPLHLAVMRRRAEWFDRVEVNSCLWWVTQGHIPDFHEAMAKLDQLKSNGPGPLAFNFKVSFAAPDN